eukprot:gene14342-24505_t
MSLSDKSPFTAVCTKFHGLMHTLPLSAQVEGKAHASLASLATLTFVDLSYTPLADATPLR